MNTTHKAVIRQQKIRDDGTAPVWIRTTRNRRSTFKSTGVFIAPRYWNEKREQVRSSHPDAVELNEIIRSLLADAMTSSAEQLEDLTLPTISESVVEVFNDYILKLSRESQYWERKKYSTTRNKITQCFGESVVWSDIRPKRFEHFLADELGNKSSTVRKELKRFRTVTLKAIRNGELDEAKNPFSNYTLPKEIWPYRRRLSDDEVERFKSLDLELTGKERLVRDVWMFSFYGAGVRFGDICEMRLNNLDGQHLRYIMNKTSRHISNKLPNEAFELLEPYTSQKSAEALIFDLIPDIPNMSSVEIRKKISSVNAVFNGILKIIAQKGGINPEGFSMHVARHSWADFARRQGGDIYSISKALGHSSIAVTERYLQSFDQDAVDKLSDDIWQK